jgi:hypothetical protein
VGERQDDLGYYIVDQCTALSDSAQGGKMLAFLNVNMRVEVLETVILEQRLRARIAEPAGWFTLMTMKDGCAWAHKEEAGVRAGVRTYLRRLLGGAAARAEVCRERKYAMPEEDIEDLRGRVFRRLSNSLVEGSLEDQMADVDRMADVMTISELRDKAFVALTKAQSQGALDEKITQVLPPEAFPIDQPTTTTPTDTAQAPSGGRDAETLKEVAALRQQQEQSQAALEANTPQAEAEALNDWKLEVDLAYSEGCSNSFSKEGNIHLVTPKTDKGTGLSSGRDGFIQATFAEMVHVEAVRVAPLDGWGPTYLAGARLEVWDDDRWNIMGTCSGADEKIDVRRAGKVWRLSGCLKATSMFIFFGKAPSGGRDAETLTEVIAPPPILESDVPLAPGGDASAEEVEGGAKGPSSSAPDEAQGAELPTAAPPMAEEPVEVAQSKVEAEASDAAPPPPTGAPGAEPPVQYIVVHDGEVPVNAAWSRNSDVVKKLPKDSVVDVVEVSDVQDQQRIRARITNPAGWVSLSKGKVTFLRKV